MKTSRRTVVSCLAVAAALSLALAGCTTGSVDNSNAGSTQASVDANAFPVTLKSNFGDTTVTKAPMRVVTIGWANQDAVLALGTVPVGIAKTTFGGDADGFTPWDAEALKQMGAAPGTEKAPKLTTANTDGTPNYDEIAKLSPDLIVAVQARLDQESFNKLSKIAPVVAYTGNAYSTSWQDMMLSVGKAMGKSNEAQKVVDETQSYVADQAKQNPALAGKSFVVGTFNPADGQGMNLYTDKDARPRLFSELGMKLSPTVQEASRNATNFYIKYSPEKAADIQADIAFFWANSDADAQKIASDPLMSQMPAIKKGAYVAETDTQLSLAVSAVSPQSLKWALSRILPKLVAAVKASEK